MAPDRELRLLKSLKLLSLGSLEIQVRIDTIIRDAILTRWSEEKVESISTKSWTELFNDAAADDFTSISLASEFGFTPSTFTITRVLPKDTAECYAGVMPPLDNTPFDECVVTAIRPDRSDREYVLKTVWDCNIDSKSVYTTDDECSSSEEDDGGDRADVDVAQAAPAAAPIAVTPPPAPPAVAVAPPRAPVFPIPVLAPPTIAAARPPTPRELRKAAVLGVRRGASLASAMRAHVREMDTAVSTSDRPTVATLADTMRGSVSATGSTDVLSNYLTGLGVDPFSPAAPLSVVTHTDAVPIPTPVVPQGETVPSPSSRAERIKKLLTPSDLMASVLTGSEPTLGPPKPLTIIDE